MTIYEYFDLTVYSLSEMRVLVEGAIVLYEDNLNFVMKTLKESGNDEERCALNDIGGALYSLREHVKKLQSSHRQYCHSDDESREDETAYKG